jgi:ubiquitin-like-conjugating enzyme ATG3
LQSAEFTASTREMLPARISSSLREWREYLTPVARTSSFKNNGEITPDEFVRAGEHLIHKFPTWSWSGAPASKRVDYLPDDKQYLVTRHVPCKERAPVVGGDEVAEVAVDEGGWVSTMIKGHNEANDTVQDIDDIMESQSDDGLEEGDLEEDDGQVYRRSRSNPNTIAPSRTYNLYMTYSKAYRVPKIYLSGFNDNGGPLSPEEMFEDVMDDYHDKTVTIERAPFEEDLTLISIHPCKHAKVMKILLERAEVHLREQRNNELADITQGIARYGVADSTAEADDWEEIGTSESTREPEGISIPVDLYLIIFLKFMATVTPGIEHDYTMEVF